MKAAYSARAWGWTPDRATRAPKPWVAEITGRDPAYGYQRRFLPAKRDTPAARGAQGDGVWLWWTLESGRVYQSRHLTGRRSGWTTRWLTVTDDGDVHDLTAEEVDQWLADSRNPSASTS